MPNAWLITCCDAYARIYIVCICTYVSLWAEIRFDTYLHLHIPTLGDRATRLARRPSSPLLHSLSTQQRASQRASDRPKCWVSLCVVWPRSPARQTDDNNEAGVLPQCSSSLVVPVGWLWHMNVLYMCVICVCVRCRRQLHGMAQIDLSAPTGGKQRNQLCPIMPTVSHQSNRIVFLCSAVAFGATKNLTIEFHEFCCWLHGKTVVEPKRAHGERIISF